MNDDLWGQPARTTRRGKGGRRVVVAIVTAAILAVLGVSAASGVIAPSTFEGNDGNTAADTAATTDWDDLGVTPITDTASGSTDSSLSGNEDDTTPTYTEGSIQPNKSDLTSILIASEQVAGTDFLYLAWNRVPDPSGNVNIDFELNQLAQPPLPAEGAAWNLARSEDDVLIMYELVNGGTVPQLTLLRWLTDADANNSDADCEHNGGTLPCWGDGTVLNPLTTPAGEAGVGMTAGGDIIFGEASIDLQAAGIFAPRACTNFGSVYAKSRASGSGFRSQLSDLIEPTAISVSNCGDLTVVKNTTGGDATFDFDVDCDDNSFDDADLEVTTSAGTGSATITDIPNGTVCTVTEADETGWTLTSANGQTTTIDGNKTITFTNSRDLGKVVVDKTASGGDGTFEFEVACPNVAGYPVTLTVTTTNGSGSAETAEDIPTGTVCTVTEAAQAGTWDITSANPQEADVDDDGTTVSFENERVLGKVVVEKTATGGDGTFEFEVDCPSVAGYPLTLTVTTTNGSGSAETAEDIPTGTICTVTEQPQAGTWSIVGADSHDVTVDEDGVTASFANSRDLGSITVEKTAVGGDGTFSFTVACPAVAGYPLTLTVTTSGGTGSASTPNDIPTGTDCTVTEAAQPGVWTIVGGAQKDVEVDDDSSVSFTNTRNTGSLTVVINTIGGNGTFPYSVDCPGTAFDADATITTAAGTGSSPTILTIPTGVTCVVTQTVVPGWTLNSPSPQSKVIVGSEVVVFEDERNVNAITVDKSAAVATPTEGETVTYTYLVRASGPDALHDVTVVDDKCTPVSFVSGDTDADNLLDPGETWTYTCVDSANASEPTNIATATGVDPGGATVSATDTVTIAVVAGVVFRAAPLPELPRTGSDLGVMLRAASTLLLLGIALVLITRRRARQA